MTKLKRLSTVQGFCSFSDPKGAFLQKLNLDYASNFYQSYVGGL